jgi:hypothetical protein
MKSDHKILLNDIEPAMEDFEQKFGAECTSTMPRKKEMTVNLPNFHSIQAYNISVLRLLSATAYPAKLGIRPLASYKSVQRMIVEFGGCRLDYDL